MNDHPYAVGNTLTPGETVEDDPYIPEEYCPGCQEVVELIEGKCPTCGTEL